MIPMNAQVTGSYYGAKYTGKIADSRLHTARFDCVIYYIALDTPITVLGATRESICIHAVNGTSTDGESTVEDVLQARCDATVRFAGELLTKHKDFTWSMAITAANNLINMGIYSL